MSMLANMIAKQKALAEGKIDEQSSNGSLPNGTDSSGAGASVLSDATDSNKPTAGSARLKFGVKGGSNLPARIPVATQGNDSGAASDAGNTPGESNDVLGQLMSLDDLADSTETGVVRGSTSSGPAFDDEIPCTAPERELDSDLTSQQLAFVQQLDSIYQIIHDPELFGDMIRTIMTELQEQPEYIKLMADQDVHTMIRGLRSSMGLAKIKKAEKSTKSRAAKKAPASSAMLTTADEIFNSEDW